MSELTFVPLANFADITMGQSPGSELCNRAGKGLPFLQGCAEFGARHPQTSVFCDPPLRTAKVGSVLISVRAPVGTMNYADQDYCIGRGLAGFKAKAGLADTVFLKHAVEHNSGYLHRHSQGSTFAAVSTTDVQSVPIPVFLTEKQNKIATIFTSIDQTIEKTEALIEKYQQVKTGLMRDLFTRGIGADGKLRPPREQAPELYQQTSIGWIPKEWVLKPIGEIFSIQLGKMLSRAAKTGKSEFSYLGNKNVQWDKVNLDNLEKMDFHPEEREKFKLVYGDLLVCEGGDVGRTAMWRNELDNCYYQKAIHRLRPLNNEVLPEFMLRFMLFAKNTGMLTNFTSQTSIAHLTREKLSEVKAFVPCIAEQEVLVERFDSIDKKISIENNLLEKLKKQKSGLMHDLLTGKVSVKIESDKPNNNKDQDIIEKLSQISEVNEDSDFKRIQEYV